MTIGAFVTIPAAPASAAEHYTSVDRSTWAYTDSRAPSDSFVDRQVDAPVGAWRDERRRVHKSRSYFTFDLTALRGAHIYQVIAATGETWAADCTKPRSTQLWLTETETRPRWSRAPRELLGLGSGAAINPCVASYVEWDATDAVRRAMSGRSNRMTLALRMPARVEHDVAYGRRYTNDMHLYVTYNRAPHVPADLAVGTRPCGSDPLLTSAREPQLSALLSDPDNSWVSGRFAIWPADDPAARNEYRTAGGYAHEARVRLPQGVVTHDREYVWAVQADDGSHQSAWSAECRFRTDHVRPDVEPGVSSQTYPEDTQSGGPGVPGEFVFTSNGVADVVEFEYSGSLVDGGVQRVQADRPGGTATVTLTPAEPTLYSLTVVSLDAAGNRSDERYYGFIVRRSSPSVSCEPWGAVLGQPQTCTFAPNMDDVVSYTYRLGDDPESTVPAGPDGTAAVTFVPPSGIHELTVFSTTAAGVRSPAVVATVDMDTAPWVHCTGDVELDCTFEPTRMAGVATWTYRMNDGPETTIAAEPDGFGRARIAASESGDVVLTVVAHDDQGRPSSPGTFETYVPDSPAVHSDTYPRDGVGGGPGVPGEFVLGPGLRAGAVEYVYWIDGDPVTVPAGDDGRATVSFTPQRAGFHRLIAYSLTADGTESAWSVYDFEVAT